jgi:hypothetical protein
MAALELTRMIYAISLELHTAREIAIALLADPINRI